MDLKCLIPKVFLNHDSLPGHHPLQDFATQPTKTMDFKGETHEHTKSPDHDQYIDPTITNISKRSHELALADKSAPDGKRYRILRGDESEATIVHAKIEKRKRPDNYCGDTPNSLYVVFLDGPLEGDIYQCLKNGEERRVKILKAEEVDEELERLREEQARQGTKKREEEELRKKREEEETRRKKEEQEGLDKFSCEAYAKVDELYQIIEETIKNSGPACREGVVPERIDPPKAVLNPSISKFIKGNNIRTAGFLSDGYATLYPSIVCLEDQSDYGLDIEISWEALTDLEALYSEPYWTSQLTQPPIYVVELKLEQSSYSYGTKLRKYLRSRQGVQIGHVCQGMKSLLSKLDQNDKKFENLSLRMYRRAYRFEGRCLEVKNWSEEMREKQEKVLLHEAYYNLERIDQSRYKDEFLGTYLAKHKWIPEAEENLHGLREYSMTETKDLD